MARTSVTELKKIFETSLSQDALQLFIDDANAIVTDRLGGEGLGEGLLGRIERYVAAHLASSHDPRTLDVKVGDASAKFEGRVRAFDAQGLSTTFYGRQAILLDSTGKLSTVGKRRASAAVALPDDFGEKPWRERS